MLSSLVFASGPVNLTSSVVAASVDDNGHGVEGHAVQDALSVHAQVYSVQRSV